MSLQSLMEIRMFLLNTEKLLDKVTENWIAKAISIGLAVLLFVFHRMTSLETRVITIPLTVQANSSLVPASSYSRIVRVSLRGDSNSIFSIQEDDIEAYIDLAKYDTEGLYRAPVEIRKRGSALGIEPLEIVVDPVEISLQLDRKISKYISLQANLTGNVDAGYEFVSHTLTPAQVMADGPLGALSAISILSTDIIDLSGRHEDFSVTVRILNQDPLILIRGSRMTEFRGFIRPSVPVRTIDGISIICKNLSENLEVNIDRFGSVRLEGSQNELDRYVLQPQLLSIDCSGIDRPGEYTRPVNVELPAGLALVRYEPAQLTVMVTVKENQ